MAAHSCIGPALIGSNGVLPIDNFLLRVSHYNKFDRADERVLPLPQLSCAPSLLLSHYRPLSVAAEGSVASLWSLMASRLATVASPLHSSLQEMGVLSSASSSPSSSSLFLFFDAMTPSSWACSERQQSAQQLLYAQWWQRVSAVPTVFWAIETQHIDAVLRAMAVIGVVLSSCMIWSGSASFVQVMVLWVMQQSVCNVGQTFWSYGWETQLLETS